MNQVQPPGTENPSSCHLALDRYTSQDLVQAFVHDQQRAASAVLKAAQELSNAVEASAERLARGGRLIYAGAGTSGRLAVLDAVELFPTFSWSRDRAPALLAGGPGAMFIAVEGAEDNREQAALDFLALEPRESDVVFAIAASGTTPFALAVIEAAKPLGCLTIGMANNPGSALAAAAQIGIVLDTGPEVISGSTRLKAGTAQKIALNSFSSSVMVRLHKVYGNLMVDLKATNAKLYQRALR
ncbi:MAG: N-acetylmuramic acid 6-phosphate etherase, partial [Betaproteobacteria bacterium]|nr:N-acetylmuramic acid 6-phosphate etherase [Betaproteobacteria bacterium]